MKLELLCLTLFFLPLLGNEIKGGPIVSAEDFPFIARLGIKKGRWVYTCTGSLVKDDLILTAKHCFQKNGKTYYHGSATFFDTFRGYKDRKEFTVKMKLIKTYPNSDLALARLTRKVSNITPLRIYNKKLSPGTTVKATGYGMHDFRQNDGHLRHIDLRVAYDRGNYVGTKIGKNNEGPCGGDSGGPLLVQTGNSYSVAGTLYGAGYDCRTGIVSRAFPDDKWSSVRVIKSGDIPRLG